MKYIRFMNFTCACAYTDKISVIIGECIVCSYIKEKVMVTYLEIGKSLTQQTQNAIQSKC